MMDIPDARRKRRSRGYWGLLKNVQAQVAGSDLQAGYSYVYVWLANQFGHFMIGFAGTIFLSWFVFWASPHALATGPFWSRLWLAALIGGAWLLVWVAKELLIDIVDGMRRRELAAEQREAAILGKRLPSSKLPPSYKIGIQDLRYVADALRTYFAHIRRSEARVGDSVADWFVVDIVRDSQADGWFYLAGVLTAIVMYSAPGLDPEAGWPWAVPIGTFVILLIISFVISRDWLWEKVAFDNARFPFVGRFALNSRPYQQDKRKMVIDFALDALPGKNHLVIIGPPKSGRTNTAVALGVEALLRAGTSIVVYITWCKLLDRIADDVHVASQTQQQELQGPDMRPAFPPEEAQLLIVDDVGAEGAQRRPFVTATAFGQELDQNVELLKKLETKRVVWVVGDDPISHDDWIKSLEDAFGKNKVVVVEPGETIAPAARYSLNR
jgi:hypothetical protein